MSKIDTTAGEYPAHGLAYISDEGILCVSWRVKQIALFIAPDGTCSIATGEHFQGGREITLDGKWPPELRRVMCDDYVETLHNV